VDNIKIIGQRLAGGHLLWVGIWSGGENIGQLGSMRRYIGYSQKIAGSRFVGRPPEYFHIYVYYGPGLWDINPGLRNIFRYI
jgi:hypothetical protein